MGQHQRESLNIIRLRGYAYGDSMTLLIKNQSAFFLQWHISPQTEKTLSIICNEPFSSLYKTIRFYQEKNDSVSYKDITITNNESYLFIEETGGSATYSAELIVFQSSMHKLTVLKSNEVKMIGTYKAYLKRETLNTEKADWKKKFSAYSVYE